jgi:hypothetical protein
MTSHHQFRGTAIFSINNAASRVMGSGRDSTGLGRWTWTRFHGRNGIATRIVCAYQPCIPVGSDKVFSVYVQHQLFFDDQLEDICPREAFIRDLCEELDEWIAQGDQVIVVLDASEVVHEVVEGGTILCGGEALPRHCLQGTNAAKVMHTKMERERAVIKGSFMFRSKNKINRGRGGILL